MEKKQRVMAIRGPKQAGELIAQLIEMLEMAADTAQSIAKFIKEGNIAEAHKGASLMGEGIPAGLELIYLANRLTPEEAEGMKDELAQEGLTKSGPPKFTVHKGGNA